MRSCQWTKYLHFLTSIEPIWFDSEKIETKWNGIKILLKLNFLPSLGKFFVDFFWLFPCFWTFFCVFQLFSKKDETKWNTYQCLDITEPQDNTYTDTQKFSEPRNKILQVLTMNCFKSFFLPDHRERGWRLRHELRAHDLGGRGSRQRGAGTETIKLFLPLIGDWSVNNC